MTLFFINVLLYCVFPHWLGSVHHVLKKQTFSASSSHHHWLRPFSHVPSWYDYYWKAIFLLVWAGGRLSSFLILLSPHNEVIPCAWFSPKWMRSSVWDSKLVATLICSLLHAHKSIWTLQSTSISYRHRGTVNHSFLLIVTDKTMPHDFEESLTMFNLLFMLSLAVRVKFQNCRFRAYIDGSVLHTLCTVYGFSTKSNRVLGVYWFQPGGQISLCRILSVLLNSLVRLGGYNDLIVDCSIILCTILIHTHQ